MNKKTKTLILSPWFQSVIVHLACPSGIAVQMALASMRDPVDDVGIVPKPQGRDICFYANRPKIVSTLSLIHYILFANDTESES